MKKVTKIDGVQKNTAINSKLRVAAYCRVSTGSDAQLESLEAQKSHYEQYINSREDWQFALMKVSQVPKPRNDRSCSA